LIRKKKKGNLFCFFVFVSKRPYSSSEQKSGSPATLISTLHLIRGNKERNICLVIKVERKIFNIIKHHTPEIGKASA
jgi:hypothetical protein